MIVRAALAILLALPQAGFQEVIDVRIHNVDVVVTNAQGQPVTGLRLSDFELREDGVVQPITNFSAYEALPAVERPTASTDAPAAARREQASSPAPRSFLFFIDDMSLDEKTLGSVSENLAKFVLTSMREGDRAAVIRPAQITNLTLQLSSDRAAVREQLVAAFAGSRQSAKTVGFENDVYLFEREIQRVELPGEARAIARRYAERATRRVLQRLGTLRALIASLGPQPGRKVLVAVMQNLSAQPGREYYERYLERERTKELNSHSGKPPTIQEQQVEAERKSAVTRGEAFGPSMLDHADQIRSGMADLRPAVTEIARLASSNGVTLYAIRPENDVALHRATADVTGYYGADDWAGPPDIGVGQLLQHAISNTSAAVDPLVTISGGRQFRPNDDLGEAMDRIAEDVANYYSLAYHGKGGLDKPHTIQVRVRNRPDLQVRARSEVVRKSPRNELTDSVAAALVDPGSAENLLHISAVEAERASSSKDLVIEVRIPMAALDFEKKGPVYRAHYTAHYAISGRVTDYISGIHDEQLIEVPEADWPSARVKHWTHVITVRRQRDERYRVAVGIMDVRSGISGITTLNVAASDGTQ